MHTKTFGTIAFAIAFFTCLFSTSFAQGVKRNPILIDHTGSWCGYCPRAAYDMDFIKRKYPETICVSIHSGDPMACSDGNTIKTQTNIRSYPSGIVDNAVLNGQNSVVFSRISWENAVKTRMAVKAPVSVKIAKQTFDPKTRALTVKLSATFEEAVNKKLNFVCYILEDSVTGKDPSYNQKNYYNDEATNSAFINSENSTGKNPFYQKGKDMPNYIHKHVLRSALKFPFGAPNSIKDNPQAGQTFEYEFKTNLQGVWNTKQIHLVGFVQVNATNVNEREILNAVEEKLDLNSVPNSIEGTQSSLEASIYPNPTNGKITINLPDANLASATVYNVTGSKVWTGVIENGNSTLDLEMLPKGIYVLNIEQNGSFANHKLVIE